MRYARRFILIRLAGPVDKGSGDKIALAEKATVVFRPRYADAAHVAAPAVFGRGEYSRMKEMCMELWSLHAPWAGRRLAAVGYNLDNNGSPHPVGWDLAARSLEFVAPQPLIRSMFRGSPAPILAIADAEKQKKSHAKGENTNIEVRDTRETASSRPATRNSYAGAKTVPGDVPLQSDALIPETPARVRLDQYTREPAQQSPKGSPKATPTSGADQLSQWIPKGRGQTATPQGHHRGGHCLASSRDAKQDATGRQSPVSEASRPSWRKDWRE